MTTPLFIYTDIKIPRRHEIDIDGSVRHQPLSDHVTVRGHVHIHVGLRVHVEAALTDEEQAELEALMQRVGQRIYQEIVG